MKLGTTIPTYCTDETTTAPDVLRAWINWVADSDIAGLWVIHHLVKPPTYGTSVLDPIVALSHAAAVAPDLDLGTSVLLLPLRRTASVVHQIASLQHLTNGTVTLGLGAGYVEKEFEVSGVPRNQRGPRLSEGLDVLQALFAGEASYDGRFHSFTNTRIDPVPEHPPRIVVGGDSKQLGDGKYLEQDARRVSNTGGREIPTPVLDRILQARGWIAPSSSPEKVREEWAIISEYAKKNGVDPATITRLMVNYTYLVDNTDASVIETEQRDAFNAILGPNRGFEHAQQQCLTGSIDEITDRLAAYEDVGFDQVILSPPAYRKADLETQFTLLTEELVPHFS